MNDVRGRYPLKSALPGFMEPQPPLCKGGAISFTSVRGCSERCLFKSNPPDSHSSLFVSVRPGNCQCNCQIIVETVASCTAAVAWIPSALRCVKPRRSLRRRACRCVELRDTQFPPQALFFVLRPRGVGVSGAEQTPQRTRAARPRYSSEALRSNPHTFETTSGYLL
jgi:hypothetical protein